MPQACNAAGFYRPDDDTCEAGASAALAPMHYPPEPAYPVNYPPQPAYAPSYPVNYPPQPVYAPNGNYPYGA